MKNFDEVRELRPRRTVDERTFVIGGETFVARDRFRPDVLIHLEGMREAEVDLTTCTCSHRPHNHEKTVGPCTADCSCLAFNPKVLTPGSTLGEQIAAVDQTLEGMIEGGDEAVGRYRTLRLREDDPIGITDLLAIIRGATASDAGRPTGEPGGSTSGRESTGTDSTGVSSPPVPQTV